MKLLTRTRFAPVRITEPTKSTSRRSQSVFTRRGRIEDGAGVAYEGVFSTRMRESQFTVNEFSVQIQELQDSVNSMNDS